jgi:hypothetical protein
MTRIFCCDAGRPGCSFPIAGFARDAVMPIVAPLDPETESLAANAPDPEDSNLTLDADTARAVANFLRDKLPDEDFAQVMQLLGAALAQDDPPPFPGMPKPGGGMVPLNRTKEPVTMDYSIARRIAMDQAERNAIHKMTQIRAAEAEVEPYVGAVMGCDSASEVFRTALERRGIATDSLHPSATEAAWRMLGRSGARPVRHSSVGFYDRFPEARRIGV